MRQALRSSFVILMSFFIATLAVGDEKKAELINWQPWSDSLFKQAKSEKKLVILDLKAIWCHWCHVMDETTYSNKDVANALSKNFIATHVDQDSRPDLASRYEDYGWPATIIFTADGKEIVKKSGYIPPDEMIALLDKVAKDPSPMADETMSQPKILEPTLTAEARKKLEGLILERYDQKLGSWDNGNKLLDTSFGELFLSRSLGGDKKAAKWLRQTLDQNLKIHDSIWGGVYQYSTGNVWNEPHFEKIMSVQADNTRIYAQASLVFADSKYLKASEKTAKYIDDFLTSPEGAFYTSQDADIVPGQHSDGYFKKGDAARRKIGIPRVDKNIYARENGWAIQALLALYAASSKDIYLQRAEKAAKWIQENRSLAGGGFKHGEKDVAGPFLGDTLSMGAAFLKLYAVTGERSWLQAAREASQFIDSKFKNKNAGYDSAISSTLASQPLAEENIQLARFGNNLFRYTADAAAKAVSQQAMKFVAIPEVSERFFVTSGALLAAQELERAPAHITLLAPKSDKAAKILWREALKYPLSYQRMDWWDKSEGPLAANDVTYPELSRAAVFTCTDSRCSLPASDIATVQKRIKGLSL